MLVYHVCMSMLYLCKPSRYTHAHSLIYSLTHTHSYVYIHIYTKASNAHSLPPSHSLSHSPFCACRSTPQKVWNGIPLRRQSLRVSKSLCSWMTSSRWAINRIFCDCYMKCDDRYMKCVNSNMCYSYAKWIHTIMINFTIVLFPYKFTLCLCVFG